MTAWGFLGRVLVLDGAGLGSALMAPFLRDDLGGATGPDPGISTLAVPCVAADKEDRGFLTWQDRFGCLWYISSQAAQKFWSRHSLQRTNGFGFPQRSHGGEGGKAAAWLPPPILSLAGPISSYSDSARDTGRLPALLSSCPSSTRDTSGLGLGRLIQVFTALPAREGGR